MGRMIEVALATAAVLLVISSAGVSAVLDPHAEPARCFSCHREIPDERDARAGDYLLLTPTIDETCAVCHGVICCESAARHRNHPTSIDRWSDTKFRRPRTLPLFDGYITCATCHLHRYGDQPENRLLLRIYKDLGNGKIDWDGLCRDCHTDY